MFSRTRIILALGLVTAIAALAPPVASASADVPSVDDWARSRAEWSRPNIQVGLTQADRFGANYGQWVKVRAIALEWTKDRGWEWNVANVRDQTSSKWEYYRAIDGNGGYFVTNPDGTRTFIDTHESAMNLHVLVHYPARAWPAIQYGILAKDGWHYSWHYLEYVDGTTYKDFPYLDSDW